ncbi:MAG: hypothetical protein JXX14_11800, partial [Deltaproteobacteria bacterium]|nr:hypothetical protein [Deltaproteobacteria bacterium]
MKSGALLALVMLGTLLLNACRPNDHFPDSATESDDTSSADISDVGGSDSSDITDTDSASDSESDSYTETDFDPAT